MARSLALPSIIVHTDDGRSKRRPKGQQYLTPSEDKAVVEFLLQMSNLGQPVRVNYIPSIAFSATRQRPTPDRPPKPPGKNWTKALENRHPELKARKVRALDWNRHEKNTYEKITDWFEVIRKVLQDPAVLVENVYNMDETGVMLSMPGSVKVLVGKDDTRDYRGARVKRTTVTAIECISADGRYLKPMIIWPATTHRSNWTTFPTPGWQYACNESGYTDSKISLEWLKRIFDPQTKERANKKPRVLICDSFGTHETLEILEYCFENNIIMCRLPSHTSHKLQPCDVAVFAPLKAAYREQVDRLERGGVNTIGKEHFTTLYSPARERAFTSKNIKAGFAASGLVPFHPEKVIRDMPKPPAALTISKADEVKVGPCPQDQVLQTPMTPATPVSAEALMSLQNLIMKQDAHALDETGKQSLQRHLHKFVKVTQTSFAKGVLQQDHIRFLNRINDEAKVRRSTKSEILAKGVGKVMSYEDLEAARAARAAKEQAKAEGKGKRGRKRKSPVEADAPEADAPEARKGKRGRKRKSPEEAVLSGINETTSDFTRKSKPKNRYWKGKVTFKFGEFESQILKMSGCDVPYVKATNYGTEFLYASLQKPVADAIIASGLKKDIIISHVDPKINCPSNEWWMTVNGINGRTGVVDSSGNFSSRDLQTIFMKTEAGVKINFDLVFNIRLTLSDGDDRKPNSVFRIVPAATEPCESNKHTAVVSGIVARLHSSCTTKAGPYTVGSWTYPENELFDVHAHGPVRSTLYIASFACADGSGGFRNVDQEKIDKVIPRQLATGCPPCDLLELRAKVTVGEDGATKASDIVVLDNWRGHGYPLRNIPDIAKPYIDRGRTASDDEGYENCGCDRVGCDETSDHRHDDQLTAEGFLEGGGWEQYLDLFNDTEEYNRQVALEIMWSCIEAQGDQR